MYLKVTIPGDYWDVQIYRGKLHLWTMEHSIITLDWTGLVHYLAARARSRFAVQFGLADGRALYEMRSNAVWRDPDFQQWMRGNFGTQANQSFDLNFAEIDIHLIEEQACPIRELPVDTEIYNKQLYMVASCGIWKASVDKGTVKPISTKPQKIHDLSAVSIRARSHQLALAATSDGLWRVATGEGAEWTEGEEQVSTAHCDKADWVFQSMFGGSSLDGSHLVTRYWYTPERSERVNGASRYLMDGGTYPITEVNGALESPGVSWAFAEKIYTADQHLLTSSQYTQSGITGGIHSASEALGDLVLEESRGRPIEGKAGVFGTAIEFDQGLQVVLSDERQFPIPGPVTRWRTYPRANNYENHLHVIHDDRLEVYGFYDDFFMDQDKKRFGVRFEDRDRFASRRSARFARWRG